MGWIYYCWKSTLFNQVAGYEAESSHFISPPKIEKLFPYPEARVDSQYEGYNAWIVVEKKE